MGVETVRFEVQTIGCSLKRRSDATRISSFHLKYTKTPWEAISCSASQHIFHFIGIRRLVTVFTKNLPLADIVNHLNPLHTSLLSHNTSL
jgi:hypothetical protein